MAPQQMKPRMMGSGHHLSENWVIGISLVVIGMLALILALSYPQKATPVALPQPQPAIGQHTVVTGLVYNGTSYVSAPITVAARFQPVIGRHSVVTGQVFNGTRYVTVPIAVGAPRTQPAIGLSTTVTGLVWDGTTYRTMPVSVGGR